MQCSSMKKIERQEIDAAIGCLYLGGKPRVDRGVAREILLQSPVFWNGRLMDVVGKSVGAGVWELRVQRDS